MLDVEVLEMLLDVGHSLAKSGTLPLALSITVDPGLLREPNRVVPDRNALVNVEQHLGNASLLRGIVSAGMAEGDDGPLSVREKGVLCGLRAVTAGNVAEQLASFFDKPVRVSGQKRRLFRWERERVASKDELSPQTDAQPEDVTLGDASAVQVGLKDMCE